MDYGQYFHRDAELQEHDATCTHTAPTANGASMIRMIYGTMQRRTIMFVGHVKRSVTLFIPPPPDKTLTNIANKTDYRQYFDDHEELQEHDHDAHTYCTDCKWGIQNKNNLCQHLNSKLHQPAIYLCPSHGCKNSFVLPHCTYAPLRVRNLHVRHDM